MQSFDQNYCVYIRTHKDVVVYVGSGRIKRTSRPGRAFSLHPTAGRGRKYQNYLAKYKQEICIEIVKDQLTKVQSIELEQNLYDQHKDTLLNSRRPCGILTLCRDTFTTYLKYDESSPTFLRWKDGYPGKKEGDIAGSRGYPSVSLFGKKYYTYRVIVTLFGGEVTESSVVDHIDGNRLNNNINNLRLTDQRTNARNVQHFSGSSGVRGISWDNRRKRWQTIWKDVDGNERSKSYSTSEFTYQESFHLSCIERVYQLSLLEKVGVVYSERHIGNLLTAKCPEREFIERGYDASRLETRILKCHPGYRPL